MKINKLHLHNFRSYSDLILNFNSNLNIFFGRNAQGKTNIVESMYFLNFTKSHRTNNDKDLIKIGSETAKIGVILEAENTKKLEIIISNKGKKAFIDNKDINKLSNFINNMNVVFFAPEHLQILKGSPVNRRRYLDMYISQLSKQYVNYLNNYNIVLKQRNEYLKMMMINGYADEDYLDILTDKLVYFSDHIYKLRTYYIEKLNKYASKYFSEVFNDQSLSISYKYSFEKIENSDLSFSLKKKLNDNKQREIQLGSTRYGPHRDDIDFFIDNKNAKDFGSQGQQRLIILSLKLSEIDIFKEEQGFYPILVLDDVLSEIDSQNQINFLKSIADNIQSFITTTDKEILKNPFLRNADCFYVNNSEVKLLPRGEYSVK